MSIDAWNIGSEICGNSMHACNQSRKGTGIMVKGKFIIGDKEKHEIDVSYSVWTGQLKVEVDGKRVAKDTVWGTKRDLSFTIGDEETHELQIKISGVVSGRIELYVDGKLFGKV